MIQINLIQCIQEVFKNLKMNHKTINNQIFNKRKSKYSLTIILKLTLKVWKKKKLFLTKKFRKIHVVYYFE